MDALSRYRNLRRAVSVEVSRLWRTATWRSLPPRAPVAVAESLEPRRLLTASVHITGVGELYEGSVYYLYLTNSSTEGSSHLHNWNLSWGDGHSDSASSNASFASHVYSSPGDYCIYTNDSDDDGSSAACTNVIVDEVTPTISISGGYGQNSAGSASGSSTGFEGSTYFLSLSFLDYVGPGADHIQKWDLYWGDGVHQTYSGSAASDAETFSHVYSQKGSYWPEAIATTSHCSYTVSTPAHVQEANPTMGASEANSTVEGSVYSVAAWFSDPGGDRVTDWIISWGDGQSEHYYSSNTGGSGGYNTINFTHIYAEACNISATVSAYDADLPYGCTSVSSDVNQSYYHITFPVTVAKATPTIYLNGSTTVEQACGENLVGYFCDPGHHSPTNWQIAWGDGTTDSTTAIHTSGAGYCNAFSHTYYEPGTETAVMTVNDSEGTYTTSLVIHVVANGTFAPFLEANYDNPAEPGSAFDVGGYFLDPGGDAPTHWQMDWGDHCVCESTGNGSHVGGGGTSGWGTADFTHAYSLHGDYAAILTVSDPAGTYCSTFDIHVDSPPPSFYVHGDASTPAHDFFSLTEGYTDIEGYAADHWLLDWGDGTAPVSYPGSTASFSHDYLQTGDFSVTAYVYEGGCSYSVGTSVEVSPAMPWMWAGGSVSVPQESDFPLNADFCYPDGQGAQSWTIDWGDGNVIDYPNAGCCLVFDHTYSHPGTMSGEVIAYDSDGNSFSVGFSEQVKSVPPLIAIEGETAAVEGSAYTLDLSALYQPNVDTILSGWTINWGDAPTGAAPDLQNVVGTATNVQHTFSSAGQYAITAQASDIYGSYGPVVLNGQLDVTFGTNGVVTTDFNHQSDIGRSVALQNDGMGGNKIVAAGATYNTTAGYELALARFTADGSPDPTFGDSGEVIAPFGGNDAGSSILVLTDQSIIVAGESALGGFALAHYSVDGVLDTTGFGSGGIANVNFTAGGSGITAMVEQDNGGVDRILVAGTVDGNFEIAAFTLGGTLDTTFNTSGTTPGELVINFGSAAYVGGMALDGSHIIIAGTSSGAFALADYNADGTPNAAFNGTGKVTQSLAGGFASGVSLAVQSDGKIDLAGTDYGTGSNDFVVARFTTTGALDTSFNPSGTVPGVAIPHFSTGSMANAIALQTDDSNNTTGVLIAGQSGSEIAIANYDLNGALQPDFGINGLLQTAVGTNSSAASILVQPDGKILLVGSSNGNVLIDQQDLALTRYEADNLLAVLPEIDGLTANAVSDKEIDLDWGMNVADATSIEVERSSDDSTFTPITSDLSISANGFQDTDLSLTEGTPYWYRVSVLRDGVQSSHTATATATTLLTAPSDIAATSTSTTGLTLGWTNNSTVATGVLISKWDGTEFVPFAALSATVDSYLITDLTEGQEYMYELQAVGPVASSVPVTASAFTLPDAPTSLATSAATDGSSTINLTWTNNSVHATDIVVERSGDDGATFQSIADLDPTATSYSDTTAAPGGIFIYRVVSLSADSASASTSSGNVTAGGGTQNTPTPTPTGFLATPSEGTSVALSWTPPSSCDTILVERGDEVIATLDGSASSFTDSTAPDATTAQYAVIAVANGIESAPASASANVPVAAPSNFTATYNSNGCVELAWENNSSQASTAYTVHRNDNSWSSYQVASGNAIDSSALSGNTYVYTLHEVGSTPASDLTATVTVPTISLQLSDPVASGPMWSVTPTVHYDTTVFPANPVESWEVDWGDGSVDSYDGNELKTVNHIYAMAGNYSVTFYAFSLDESSDSATQTINDISYSPSIIVPEGLGVAAAGEEYALPVTLSNPGDANISAWYVDWGDGSEIQEFDDSTATPYLAHTYPHGNNSFHVIVSAFTDAGVAQYSGALSVTDQPLTNWSSWWDPLTHALVGPITDFYAPPVLGLRGVEEPQGIDAPPVVLDPSPNSAKFTFCGTPGGRADYTIDWGDGGSGEGYTIIDGDSFGMASGSHQYERHGSYFVTWCAGYVGDGGYNPYDSAEAQQWFYVAPDAEPAMALIPTQYADIGQKFTVSATFAGMEDANDSAFVDWGDGEEFPATISGHTISATIDDVPPDMNNSATITVYDDDGNSTAQSFFIISSALTLQIGQWSVAGGDDPAIEPPANINADYGESDEPYYSIDGSTLVPGFADGYGLNPLDSEQSLIDQTTQETMITITLPAGTPINSNLSISYDDSDPACVTWCTNDSPSSSDDTTYSLPSGGDALRLWTNPGARTDVSLESDPTLYRNSGTGYFVPPGTYPLADLLPAAFSQPPIPAPNVLGGTYPLYFSLEGVIKSNPGGILSASIGGETAAMTVTVNPFELSIDSDNTTAPAGGDSQSEQNYQAAIQADPTLSGADIVVNDADKNANGIPDFADGYTFDKTAGNANTFQNFVPMTVEIPDGVDPDSTQITFGYSGSDPLKVQNLHNPAAATGYAPASGNLRIWTVAGNMPRSGLPLESGGNYIVPGSSYTLGQLNTKPGSELTLYVEAVRPSALLGDRKIQATISTGSFNSSFTATSAVRITAIQAQAFYYGSSANTLLGDATGSDGGDPMQNTWSGAVDLADGTIATPAATDMASDGFGTLFGLTRVWSNRLVDQLTPGAFGNNWVMSDIPALVNAETTIIANIDGNSSLYFDQIPSSSGGDPTYKARYFSQENLATSGTAGNATYTLTDTVGDQFVFAGFDSSINIHERGRIQSFADPSGNTITYHWNTVGQLTSITRGTETWTLAYNPSSGTSTDPFNTDPAKDPANDPNDPTPYQVKNVSLSRTSGIIEQVDYAYYSAATAAGQAGGTNDLKTAVLEDAATQTLATSFYRYVVGGSQTGMTISQIAAANALQMVVAPSGFARTNFPGVSAGVSALQPYAQIYLLYAGGRPREQDILGAGNTGGDIGNYYYTFAASTNLATGANLWTAQANILLPAGNGETVFANSAGEMMLDAETNTKMRGEWDTAYIYDPQGRLTLLAMPSAVTGYDLKLSNLIGQKAGGFVFVRSNSGLIDKTQYATVVGGKAIGFESEEDQIHGTGGTAIPLSKSTYVEQTANGVSIYLPASQTVFADVASGDPRTTTETYSAWTNFQPGEMTTTTPSGEASSAYFDPYGRVQWTKDALGYLDFTAYDDATGAVTDSVIDDSGPTGGGGPSRGSGLPTALALTTVTLVDNLGRPTEVADPNGVYTVYSYPIDTDKEYKVVVTPPVGPQQVTDDNYANATEDVYTLANDGSGQPLSFTRTKLDTAGRATEVDQYWDSSSLSYAPSNGAVTGAFYPTTYGYDSGGRQNVVTDPLGTITTTDYDGLGRVIDEKMANGTAAGAVSEVIQTDQYDDGGVGDGDLTKVTINPGPDNRGVGLPLRIATTYYDWRDRAIATDNGVRLTVDTLDNLGETTQENVYDDTISKLPAYVAPDGFQNGNIASVNSGAGLRAETKYEYDKDGNLSQATQVGVYQNDGTFVTTGVASLISNTYYDADGDTIATSSPTGLWTRTTYDGAGRATGVFQTDGPTTTSGLTFSADASYNAFSLIGSYHVFSEELTTYDADGNAILTTEIDRQQGDTASTGPLGDAAGVFNGVEADSGVANYVASYYDAADRLTATVNAGNNNFTAWARPNTAPGASSGNVLVTSYGYDPEGNLQKTTDPNGTITQKGFDMLGRVSIETDDDTTAGINRVTNYAYNGDNEQTLVRVQDVIPGTAGVQLQDTNYTYGQFGSLDKSDLTTVRYPDGTTQQTVYDWLGEPVKQIDRAGNTHQYEYDGLGRQLSDFIKNFGADVDQHVQALVTAYDVLDRPVLLSSEGFGGKVLNQVSNVYDPFGQLATQYQESNGSAAASSYKVRYIYDSSNPTRLQRLVYPSGRVIWYGYSGLDASISRVSSISDGTTSASNSTPIETYNYMGLGEVGAMSLPEPGITENVTLNADDEASDIDWSKGTGPSATDLDQIAYGYDADGNVTSQDNMTADAAGHTQYGQTFSYNALNQLTSYAQGTLDINHMIPTAVNFANFTLDSQGNRVAATYNGVAQTVPSFNAANQFNNQRGVFAVQNGAETEFKLSTTGTPVKAKYDAWNRAVYLDSAEIGQQVFDYDAQGRLIDEKTYQNNDPDFMLPPTGTRFLYAGQNDIEERDLQGNLLTQYVFTGAGPSQIVLRDRGNDRVYALGDAFGSTAALTDRTGGVLEYEIYDQDGRPTSIQSNWMPFTAGGGFDSRTSRQHWQFMWHGQRWDELYQVGTAPAINGGGGLYELAGGMLYDPQHGRSVQPFENTKPGTNEYQSGGWNGGPLAVGAIKMVSWLGGPVVGIPVNWFADSQLREIDGNDNAFWGGLGDATGLSGVFNGMSEGSWSQAGLGILQLGGTLLSFDKPLGVLQGPISTFAYGPTMSELAAPVVNEVRNAAQATAITARFFLNGGFGPPPALAWVGGGIGVGSSGVGSAGSAAASTFGGWGGSGIGLAGGLGNAVFSIFDNSRTTLEESVPRVAVAETEAAVEAQGGVYLLRDAETGQVMRTGRTNDLLRRQGEHGRDPLLKDYDFEPVYRTNVYAEQRGLEQELDWIHNPPLNFNRPINPQSQNLSRYLRAANDYLDKIQGI